MNTQSLIEKIVALSKNRQRIIVAIAGAPASGKSTLAEALVPRIDSAMDAAVSVVLPMDGYHYDNAVIEPLGLLPRKGSPETFDAHGFLQLLNRLQEQPGKAIEESVAIPVFDRDLDLARAGAVVVGADKSVVVVEGNYLLLDREPWTQLANYFDLTVMLEVPEEILEQRLVARWLTHDHTEQEAMKRARQNDLPNAKTVIAQSRAADITLQS